MHLLRKRSLFFLLLSFSLALIQGQDREIFFENLREREGLPYHLVQDIDEDSLGRIWIATYNGVYRYDGYTFMPFQHNPLDSQSISSNLCRSLYIDSEEFIWVGSSQKGLCRIFPHSRKVQRFAEDFLTNDAGKASPLIHRITEDSFGDIWVHASGGLFQLKKNDGEEIKANHLIEQAGLKHKDIRSLFGDQDGRLWIGTRSGLFLYDISRKEYLEINGMSALREGNIRSIIGSKDGRVWLGLKEKTGIYFYDPLKKEILPYPHIGDFSQSNRVHLAFENEHILWVLAGRSGVFRHDLRNRQQDFFEGKDYEQNPGNFQNFTHSPLRDQGGNMWFCGGGLHKLSYTNKKFTQYTHPLSNYQSTAAIYDDPTYRITSIYGQGVILWKKSSNEFTHLKKEQGLKTGQVYAISAWSQDSIFLAGSRGIQLFRPSTESFGSFTRIRGGLSFIEKWESRFLLAGKRGIWTWVPQAKPDHIFKGTSIKDLAKDAAGNYWLASIQKGLIKWNPLSDSLQMFSYNPDTPQSIQSNRVEQLDIDSRGKIWLATGAGVESFDPQKGLWTYFKDESALAGIRANAIRVYKDREVWVSNNQGISVLKLADGSWTHYNERQGILNAYFYERSFFENEAGSLFFGGRKGVVHFLPEDIRQDLHLPRLYIDSVKVDNQAINYAFARDKAIQIDWRDQYVEITFMGVHLSNPQDIQYEYRLLPNHQDWIPIQERRLFYSGLGSGRYSLEIRAANADGLWMKEALKIPIDVAAPFWESTSFILLCVLILGLLFWFFFRRREIRLEKEHGLQSKIYELERSALRAQMNPHFIFNAMNGIQHFISEGDETSALKYLSKLSRMIRKILDYSHESFIPLEEELTLLKNYIFLEEMRFDRSLNQEIILGEGIDTSLLSLPPMLLQPIVENAINHGLLPLKEREAQLSIAIEDAGDECLSIQIRDNGIGRVAAAARNKRLNTSKGSQLVSDRIKLAAEQMGREGKFEIQDLYDPQGNALGTLVKLQVPYTYY
ncbi:MAG: histidine kinase [Bacteroidota bacterium]